MRPIHQDDYEGHMALPQVAQAGLLADALKVLLKEFSAGSIAVLGCAGGNIFERISCPSPKLVG